MRLHRFIPVLAAVVTLAGAAPASAAYLENSAGSGGTPIVAGQQHSNDSADGVLIAAGTVGAITLLGAGVAVTRRRARRAAHRRPTAEVGAQR